MHRVLKTEVSLDPSLDPNSLGDRKSINKYGLTELGRELSHTIGFLVELLLTQ